METTSYSQSPVAANTSLTMMRGVICGPDGILIGVRRPDARTLMFVPPTSMTRIFMGGRAIVRSFSMVLGECFIALQFEHHGHDGTIESFANAASYRFPPISTLRSRQ